MPIVLFLFLFSLYIAAGTVVLKKIFPSTDSTSVAIGLTLCNTLAFFAVVLNGVCPSIPLKGSELFPFLIVFYLAMVMGNTMGLKHILEQQGVSYIACLLIALVMNLGLVILLGVPLFNAAFTASNLLFKI